MNRSMLSVLAALVLGGATAHAQEFHAATAASHLPQDFAAQSMFAGVCQIHGWQDLDGPGGAPAVEINASGVLVNPWTVLTAGHVSYGLLSCEVTFGANAFTNYTERYTSTSNWTIDSYSPGHDPRTQVDLGLIYLPTATSIAPSELYTGTLTVGMDLLRCGFGELADPEHGVIGFDGDKRGGTNQVIGFGPGFGAMPSHIVTGFEPIGFPGVTELECGSTRAFSGGPDLVLEGGNYYISAVHSWGFDAYYYGTLDGAQSVGPFADTLRAHYAVPAPGSAAVLLAAVTLARRRRRRELNLDRVVGSVRSSHGACSG